MSDTPDEIYVQEMSANITGRHGVWSDYVPAEGKVKRYIRADTPTSEARKAALYDLREQVEKGSVFLSDAAIYIIEAALQQPDTSEAVRVLVDALQSIHLDDIFDITMREIAGQALKHPAVIAAMKGVDHGN